MSRNRILVALAWTGALLIPNPAPAQQGDGPRREQAERKAAQRRAETVERAEAQARTMIRVVAGFSPSGLNFAEVSDAIRAQVDIPEDSGVVIVNVRPGSPAMKAGFRANDLLLAIDGEAVRGVAQARESLAKERNKEVKAKVLRAGKEEEVVLQMPAEDVHREYTRRLFEAPAFKGAGKSEYWIGVPVSPVDPTLRSHLASLPPEAGLIVNDVTPGSPAEKAGLKKNDILVTMDSKPLASPKALVDQVHASEGKPVPLEYLRGGKPNTVKITPEKHEAFASNPLDIGGDHLIFRGPGQHFRGELMGGPDPNRYVFREGMGYPGPAAREFEFQARIEGAQVKEFEDATKRLEAAIKEMTAKVEDVRKSVEQLRRAEGEGKAKDEK